MTALQMAVCGGILPGLEGSATLFLTLVLCRLSPMEHWRRCLPLVVGFGAACGAGSALTLPDFWVVALVVVLAVAVKFLLSVSWMYGAIAGLMSGCLFGMQRLIAALPVPEYALLLGSLALAVLCWWRRAAVLPKLSEVPIAGDKEQRRRFLFTLTLIAAALCGLLLWLCCLLPGFSELAAAERFAGAAFSAFALLVLLAFTRRLAFGAVERIEALIDKQYQAELLNLMQIIRSQRHDFNFHIQAISGMMEAGRFEECRDYVRQMAKNTSVMNDVLPLHDPAVSAMLNSFREMALQKGITMDVSIHNDLARLPCSVYETNTIIGNLIQNAIDEVEEKTSERWINVLILKRGGDIIIKVTNPCSHRPEELKNIFRPGFSTKQSHEGIGLTTVARLAARYHGSVHPEFDSGAISMIVRISAQSVDFVQE